MDKKHKTYLKLNLVSLFFVALSFISVTLAWFAYTGLASSSVNVDIKAWHIEFNGQSSASNEIVIPLSNIYPGMDTVVESVNIKNYGDSDAKLSYTIESVRILDEELDMTLDQNVILDKLSNDYPFDINISISKQYLDAHTGEASIDLSVSWPLDSDNDEEDSIWGNKTYEFQTNENLKKSQNKDYNVRTSVRVVIALTAEQNLDKFVVNTGNMVLYNPVLNSKCDTIGDDCYKTNMISPYFNKTDNVLLLPTLLNNYGSGKYSDYPGLISSLTNSWESEYSLLELKDLINLVSLDINNTLLVRRDKKVLSDNIVGYISEENRFDNYIKDKVIDYEGYITFDSKLFNYLDTNKCYWINYEYDENRAFALTKSSDGIMKIYPEDKNKICYIVPLIKVNKEKLY